jgi:HlyD family secretion protein
MRTFHRFSGKRLWQIVVVLILIAAVIAGCSFTGAATPTPVAIGIPTYAPGATVAAPSGSTPAATAAGTAQGTAATTGADAAPAPASTPAAAFTAPGSAAYSAEIVADKQVVVAAQVGAPVAEVLIDVGDRVKAGDVLVRLDSAALEAQRAQALASLDAAKSQLDLLQDPAKAQDIAAAQAGIDAAAAAYARATNGPTAEEKRLALAQLKSSEAAVTVAQAAYNRVKGDPSIGMMPQSLQLEQATLGNEAAQAQYDKILKGATADQVAAAYAQLANARAALQRLQDGAKPAQVHAAEAQMHALENALYLAQLQVNKATITAPMDGVVSKLQTATGALASANAPLLTMLSNDVRVTIPVEETRLGQLKVGQPASVRVDAYPDRTFDGVVAIIAPELDPATRTVMVTIRPQDDDGLLAPGMSATALLLNQ